jgi:GNAT superfamily N-acetyltransferase
MSVSMDHYYVGESAIRRTDSAGRHVQDVVGTEFVNKHRVDDRTAEDIARCIESNYLIDYSLAFSRGAEGRFDGEGPVIWSYSGIAGQAVNWVTQATIDGEEREQIARTIARYRDWETSFWWIVGPGTRPVDLSKHLLEAGLTHLFTGPGMALSLDTLPIAWDTPAGVTIRHLSHGEALDTWADIDISVMTASDRAYVHDAFAGIPASHAPDWFVAYRGDEPVSRCLTFVGSDRKVVSIHNLYTVPSAARQGIGTAVSRHALAEARSRGCDLAVLVASEPGERIYRKMGFETFCKIHYYAWQYIEG